LAGSNASDWVQSRSTIFRFGSSGAGMLETAAALVLFRDMPSLPGESLLAHETVAKSRITAPAFLTLGMSIPLGWPVPL
jgi:hypothetical protein